MREHDDSAATIVIPLLNQRDDWLNQSVRSALNQSVPCQVVVVTSAQTRHSNLAILEDLRRSSGSLAVVRQRQRGFAVALNLGIARAAASRVGLLLSDDWLELRAVEECLQHSADIVCTGHTVYAADGVTPVQGAGKLLTMQECASLPDLEAKASYLEHFFLFQRQRLLEVGGVDETLGDSPGIDDYDLIWVLLEHGASLTIVEKSLYNYRDHTGERLTLRSPEDMRATLQQILTKHGIHGRRREALLAHHAKWFGRPIHEVLDEQQSCGTFCC